MVPAAVVRPTRCPMSSFNATGDRSVLILKTDRLYAEILRQYAARAFAGGETCIATNTDEASRLLAAKPRDIFVTDATTSLEGDVLDLLTRCASAGARRTRVLIVTSSCEVRVLGALRALDVGGVFDSTTERPEQLVAALSTVADGGRYWSPSILQHMQRSGTGGALSQILTALEQLVLALIGDGCDDFAGALKLGVSPATIATVRRDLHRKLGVQHRGELVRVAAQHGFVRFTPEGVVRPGFSILLAAYQARRARRLESKAQRLATSAAKPKARAMRSAA